MRPCPHASPRDFFSSAQLFGFPQLRMEDGMSSRRLVSGVALGAIVSSLFIFGGGCLTRPVVAGNPVTKTNFTVGYNTTTIDKIDILFDIDNSSSMGDKQQYLQAAVPDLITRLVAPNCVDSNGNNLLDANGVQLTSNSMGICAMGSPEFPPVHDLHIGVLTSSLGPRGTTSICQTSSTTGATQPDYLEFTSGSYQTYVTDSANDQFTGLTSISKNNDDEAHLINRTDLPSDPNGATSPLTGEFLAWAPPGSNDTVPSTAVTETVAATLESDFQNLVVGSQAYGCGIESQLESWYRFLVQPDPYGSITTTKNGQGLLVASWSGLDNTILQQRHDFLRPDSLVLIVVLTDEDDSEVDVRTIGGIGVNWLDNNFEPPLGTTACANGPTSSGCTSCAFNTMPKDPNCMMSPPVYTSTAAPNWGFNDNLRHVHMKQKYGVDLQFPLNRYVLGLTSQKVPNRSGEYPSNGNGYYQGGLNNDPQDLNCSNPLFSTNLPTSGTSATDTNICNLTASTVRTPANNLVYFAHIGGVPNELLTTTTNGMTTVKETLAASDWQAILGMDPENYNFSGIDPHMLESYQPRSGIPVAGSGATIQGDEAPDWYTDGNPSSTFPQRVNLPVDREYACVFKLANPRNCDPNNTANSEADISSCDCSTAGPGGMAPTLPADHVPSVCNAQNPLQQDYAKTYPTVRELLLAEKLGAQGIVSSLCPIDLVDNAAGNDPLYGYRPAITSIIDRLKTALTTTCLPETLTETEAGAVPCLVLVTLPSSMGQDNSQCTNTTMYPSLTTVESTILQEFKNDQAAAFAQSGGTNLSLYTTCQINQVLPADFQGTCKNNTNPATPNSQGWCYITGGGSCPQSLQFSSAGLPQGGIVSLQCLENSSDFASGNGTGGGTSSTASGSSSGATTATGSSSGATTATGSSSGAITTGVSDAAAE
jgi:hypothetical protein